MKNPRDGRETLIIAEVKLWSPRGERLTNNDFETQLRLADKLGDMISILTHPIWKGSREHLTIAQQITNKPLLAKDFHSTDYEIAQSIEAGASYFLSVGRTPGIFLHRCLVEPLSLEELALVPERCWAVWNSRDLSSLKDLPGIPSFLLERWQKEGTGTDRKREPFSEARKVFRGKLVQASNLKTVNDIEAGADAVLVGSNLEKFAASLGITI